MQSGMVILPGALITRIMSTLTGRIFDRFGAKWLTINWFKNYDPVNLGVFEHDRCHNNIFYNYNVQYSNVWAFNGHDAGCNCRGERASALPVTKEMTPAIHGVNKAFFILMILTVIGLVLSFFLLEK